MKRLCLITLSSLFVFSCSMAPAKKDMSQEIKTEQFFQTETSLVTREEISPFKWWEQFEDDQLNRIVEKAVLSNLDIMLAINRVELLKTQFSFSRRVRFPILSGRAGANYGRTPAMGMRSGTDAQTGQPSMEFGFSPETTGVYNLSTGLSFELDIWGRLKSTERAAIANLKATKEDLQTVYLSVISQVVMLYFDIAELLQLERLNIETLDLNQTLYELAQKRYESGNGSVNEVEQAFGQLESSRAALADTRSKLTSKIYAISILLGETPNINVIETTHLSMQFFHQAKPVPAALPSSVFENRADIKSAELKVEAARQEIGAARADLFPRISLTGMLGYLNVKELSQLFSSDYLTATVGADINYTLAGGSKLAVVDQKFVLYEQAQLNYKKTVINAFKEIEEALLAIENAEIQKESIGKRIESMEKIVENSRYRYKNGLLPYSQLVELEKNLISLKQLQLSIEKGALLSRVQLHRALGGNWIE